ncbi:MAG: hypothetical protein QOI41_1007 [Myxococcales bacterium]|nr:hypothetical protein [Myxococcales bacterium]
MRLPSNAAFLAAPLLVVLAACTAQGSTTTVQGPGGTSGNPVFPPATDGTGDGGTTTDTGTTDYAALFGPPASTDATPNALNGLWAGKSGYSSADTRLKFSGSSIVIALKCGLTAIGIDVVARVTASSIKTLESKTYTPPTTSTGQSGTKPSSSCAISVTPLEVPRCTSTTDTDASYESSSLTNGCFFLSGTSLTFYDSSALAGSATLTKLSD